MKRRIISAIATGLLGLTLLTSTTGITMAGTEDPKPAQRVAAPGASVGNKQLPKGEAPGRPENAVGTAFTYQGSLKDGANPANGQYDLQLTLFDAATGGSQVGSSVTVANQSVTNGLFTVQLDFGPSAFQGSGRWLEIAVRSTGGGNFTTLSPRQPLTAAPYAMSLEPGAVITGTVPTGGSILAALATGSGNAIYGQSNGGSAYAGIIGEATGTDSNGVVGVANNGSNAWGVYGYSDGGTGVHGTSNGGNEGGVVGENYSGFGVIGNGFTGVSGVGTDGDGVRGATTYGSGVSGSSSNGSGGYFTSVSGNGVLGQATGSNVAGVSGSNSSSGPGIYGTSDSGPGASGISGSGTGVSGQSGSGVGGYFTSTSDDAIQGHASADNRSGVAGFNTGSGPGTYGTSGTGPGLSGASDSGAGATGQSTSGYGVSGTSSVGDGVNGVSSSGNGGSFSTNGSARYAVFGVQYAQDGTAIMGTATNGTNSVGVAGSGGSDGVDGSGGYYGVYGKGTGTTHFTESIYGEDPANHCSSCFAGYFNYDVNVNGTLYANLKDFKIDDPLDPANKYLVHTSVESPDMMNIYNGNVTLDARGEAVVQMPDYFQALNTDFRYQLSAMGAAQPNLYVAQEIKDNTFKIAGGAPGGKVSWQVTGVRHDPYALANPSPVEVQKPPEEQGLYQHPELYNQPPSKAISTLYDNGKTQPPAQPQADTKRNK